MPGFAKSAILARRKSGIRHLSGHHISSTRRSLPLYRLLSRGAGIAGAKNIGVKQQSHKLVNQT